MCSTRLTWLEWLTLSGEALAEMGLDPNDRVRKTGHRYAMSEWASTAGLWGGVRRPRSIRRVSGASESAYGVFKMRWKLKATPSIEEWWLSQLTYEVMSSVMDDGRAPGLAAYQIWSLAKGPDDGMGILPVELCLRYHAFKAALDFGRDNPEIESTEDLWLTSNAQRLLDLSMKA